MKLSLPWRRPKTRPAAASAPAISGPSTRAVVFSAPMSAELRQVPIPRAGEWDITADVTFSGISMGTERWALSGARPDVSYPCIPGYLGVGRVRQRGARVEGFEPGERIKFFTARVPEGYAGNWMCAHMACAVIDCNPASYMPDFDMPYCLKIPDQVSDEEAVFAGLAGVSTMGVEMAAPQPGETVAVFGLGMIGQFAAQLAKARGARVFACDTIAQRADAAVAASAHMALVYGAPNFEAALRQFAPKGFDVVIDTTGSAQAVNAEFAYLRPGGRFVFQGWYPGMTALNLHNICVKFTRAFFPCGVRRADVARALELMAQGKLNAKALVTNRWRPEDAPQVYARILQNDPTLLGEVINWQS